MKNLKAKANVGTLLSSRGDEARVNFLKAEITLASTYCQLAHNGDDAHLERYLRNARMAYDTVVRFVSWVTLTTDEDSSIQSDATEINSMLKALQERRDFLVVAGRTS